VGGTAAIPAAALVLLVFIAPYPGFALTLAGASVGSGIVSGATFARGIAANPRTATVIWGAVFGVLIGTPIGGLLAFLLVDGVNNPFTAMVAGLALYGLPALLVLALPAFIFGVWLAGKVVKADQPRLAGVASSGSDRS
jgi:hypothetical protein